MSSKIVPGSASDPPYVTADARTSPALSAAPGRSSTGRPSWRRLAWAVLLLLAIVVPLGVGLAKYWPPEGRHADKPADMRPGGPVLQLADPNTLEVRDDDQQHALKTAVVSKPAHSRTLRLRGSLAINPNKLVHVHARFQGQIMALATVVDPPSASTHWISPDPRPLAALDPVSKDMRIAVLWSKDLGEKKSELVDTLARLRIDRQNFARLEDLAREGAIAERSLREARRLVEVGEIAVFKAERTLRSWGLSDNEIDQVEKEAELIHNKEKLDKSKDKDWARVDIVAPSDGVIVEKNVAVGDIVDTNTDLFKIADLSELSMWLHAYEEDLTALQQLPLPLEVRVSLPSNPELGELGGKIERVGQIIDPNEHMALLVGSLPNPKGNLRAGQFVSAALDLPPEPGVVTIPTKAMTDAGNESVVYVQDDPHVLRYRRTRVCVVRRLADVVQVRSELSDAEKGRGFQELHEGELVVNGGVLELEQYLQEQNVAGGGK